MVSYFQWGMGVSVYECISLTEMPFLILQVNFHTSNDFCDWRLLKDLENCKQTHVSKGDN